MNYDVTARVLVNELNDRYYISPRDLLSTPFDLQSAIADALRRAANEAAWGAYDMLGNGVGPDEWYKKYGPRPEGGTR